MAEPTQNPLSTFKQMFVKALRLDTQANLNQCLQLQPNGDVIFYFWGSLGTGVLLPHDEAEKALVLKRIERLYRFINSFKMTYLLLLVLISIGMPLLLHYLPIPSAFEVHNNFSIINTVLFGLMLFFLLLLYGISKACTYKLPKSDIPMKLNLQPHQLFTPPSKKAFWIAYGFLALVLLYVIVSQAMSLIQFWDWRKVVILFTQTNLTAYDRIDILCFYALLPLEIITICTVLFLGLTWVGVRLKPWEITTQPDNS